MLVVMSSNLLAGSVMRSALHVAEMVKPKTDTVAGSGYREGETPRYSQRRGPISTINTAPDRPRIPFHDHINADVPDSTHIQYPPTGWKFEIELTYLQTLHVNVW
jgi:hypothetical protein